MSKIGILLTGIVCFLGSIVVVEVERYLFNKIAGFNMSLSDGILLWFALTLITFSTCLPIIGLIYILSKRVKSQGTLIAVVLLVTFAIAYSIALNLSQSYFEALYLTTPYFIFALIFEVIYLKLQKPKLNHQPLTTKPPTK